MPRKFIMPSLNGEYVKPGKRKFIMPELPKQETTTENNKTEQPKILPRLTSETTHSSLGLIGGLKNTGVNDYKPSNNQGNAGGEVLEGLLTALDMPFRPFRAINAQARALGQGKGLAGMAEASNKELAGETNTELIDALISPFPKAEEKLKNNPTLYNVLSMVGIEDLLPGIGLASDFNKIKRVGQIPSTTKMLKNTADVQKGIVNTLPKLQDDMLNKIKPTTVQGKFTVKNKPLEQAQSKFEEAIQTIQNKFGTNELRKSEEALIKNKLGIDLDKLLNDYAKSEQFDPMSLLKDSSLPRLRRASGVTNKRTDDILKRIIEQPRQQKKSMSVLDDITNKTAELKTSDVTNQIDDLLQNSDNWKDKSSLSLNRETIERNFEDVMGKDADKMKEFFIDPIRKNEADRIRFLNKERKEIKDLNLSKKESELVQKYGEGVISLDELKAQTKDWKKVVKATDVFRKKYDRFLNEVNEVLTRNGYEPIPKRANYFPHFEEIDGLFKKLGIEIEDFTLPTEISGRTAYFKPGKNWFANALRRKGNKTTYDAIQGFDKYVEGLSRVKYHTDDIKRLRELEKAIRTKYNTDSRMPNHLSNFIANLKEYTDQLAGKKATIDRGPEQFLGRKIYSAVDLLRRRTSANMIGANISSALTNFIPLTQSLATTSKPNFIQGMFDTMIRKKDDLVNKSDFLTKRRGSDRLYMLPIDKAAEKAGWLFKAVDNFVAETIVRSKYYEGLSKGLPEKEALKQADEWAQKMMAGRALGDLPTMFNSRTLGLLTQFQLEINNQLSFIFKDILRNSKNKAQAMSQIAQVFVYGWLFNNLYEKIVGRRPAFDPINVAVEALEDYNNPELSKGKATANTIDNIADQLPFASTITGGGRIPISQAIPNIIGMVTGESDISKELMKPATTLLPPFGGSQAKKTFEGIDAFLKGGNFKENSKGEKSLQYLIEQDLPNLLKTSLFGKYSVPNAKEYYRNNRRPLTPKQTQQTMMSKNPQQTYDSIMNGRVLKRFQSQLMDILDNKNMSWEEKIKKIDELKEKARSIKNK